MSKLADTPPAFCSVCFQAGSEKRYVDFGAAYDGPVLTLEDGRKQPIDDLVICEHCLHEAFSLLDPDGLHQEIDRLLGLIDRQITDIEKKDRMVIRLERTLAELVEHPVKTSAGVQYYTGIPDDLKKTLNKRRKQREIGKKVGGEGFKAGRGKQLKEKADAA